MTSREPAIQNPEQMARILQKAVSAAGQSSGPAMAGAVDEELLALLATGGIGRLPPAQQGRLLDAVAADQEAAALVRHLAALDMVDIHSRAGRPSTTNIVRIMRVTWAVAACLMIGLFVWRMAVPTPMPPIRPTVTPYDAPTGPDYWGQLDQQRLQARQQWYQYRDIALVISTATCGLLAIGLVLVGARRKSDGAG